MIPLISVISGLTSVAPTIAKLLGGDKAGDAAQSIADMACKVTGLGDAQGAVNEVLTNPTAQLEFMKQLNQNNTALEKAYLEDMQDARENNKHSVVPAFLVFLLTAMVCALGYALFSKSIPADNSTLANLLFGALLAKWGDSIAYWVGTTRGSAEKMKSISK